MYCKYANEKDLNYLKETYAAQIENLPYKSNDSIYKNFIIYDFVLNSVSKKNKFIDCGAGPSPLGYLLCDYFDDGYLIDISVKNPFQKNNLHHNIGDFFSYIENHKDESFDFVLDGCSITHFNHNEISNLGMIKTAQLLRKKIKKNGFFVMSSDVLPHNVEFPNFQNEYLKVKNIIQIFESENFKIISDFDYSSFDSSLNVEIDYYNKGQILLNYCNIIFEKK